MSPVSMQVPMLKEVNMFGGFFGIFGTLDLVILGIGTLVAFGIWAY